MICQSLHLQWCYCRSTRGPQWSVRAYIYIGVIVRAPGAHNDLSEPTSLLVLLQEHPGPTMICQSLHLHWSYCRSTQGPQWSGRAYIYINVIAGAPRAHNDILEPTSPLVLLQEHPGSTMICQSLHLHWCYCRNTQGLKMIFQSLHLHSCYCRSTRDPLWSVRAYIFIGVIAGAPGALQWTVRAYIFIGGIAGAPGALQWSVRAYIRTSSTGGIPAL